MSCANRPDPAAQSPIGAPAADFQLGLTILPTVNDNGEPVPGARWVLDASGRLRAGVGLGITRDTFPPLARTLDEPDRQALEALARQAAGRSDGIELEQLGSTPPLQVDPGPGGMIINYRSQGRWHTVAYPATAFALPDTGPADPTITEGPVRTLLDTLRSLSWMSPR